jgi:hypothetical protein
LDVVESAPRYDPRILDAMRALDERGEPMAEIARRVGRVAAELGLPKPSYVHLRRYLIDYREHEDFQQRRRQEIRAILWDVYWDATYGKRIDPWEVEGRIREAGR